MAEDEVVGPPPVLVLESKVTISEIREFHVQLTKRSEDGGPVKIDASQVENIDGAGLQLLDAFVNFSRAWIRGVVWVDPSPAFVEAVKMVGMAEHFALEVSDSK